MIDSQYKWDYLCDNLDHDELNRLEKETKLSPILVKILVERGFKTVDEINNFLHPNENDIHSPFDLHDMQKAVDRIQEAIMNGEKVVIYGDYDADGITSTAIMYETLLELGADVSYYVPDRFKDGYGPDLDQYKRLKNDGMQLLITVDNGVSGFDEIKYLNAQGIDVIVTDHHEIPQELPPAFAIVHPDYPGSNYPFKGLAGVGVAFKVACALLEEIPEDLLDLVAIGTVADVMPLVDENRILVRYGLQALQMTNRPGLLCLYDVAGIKPNKIDADTIGFALAPRLNALGRIKDASLGVRLLTTLDEEEAASLAKQTQKYNEERQSFVNEIMQQCQQQLLSEKTHLVNIIKGKGWHEGVLGIVASRIAEQTKKPTIVLTKVENGIYKGSGRSVNGFDLFKAFDGHRDLFESFGGHQMACGLSISEEKISSLQVISDQEARNQDFDVNKKETIDITDRLVSTDISLNLINEIEKLSPFGMQNNRPIFEFENLNGANLKIMGTNQEHYRIDFKANNQNISAVKFNVSMKEIEMLKNCNINNIKVVGELGTNEWHGKTSIQIRIKDIKEVENQQEKFIDARVKKLTQNMFKEDILYGFFNKKIQNKVMQTLHHPIQSVLLREDQSIDQDKIVIVDCPDSLELFENVLSNLHVDQIVLKCYSQHNLNYMSLPTHEDFVKLYRFTSTHQNINLNTDLDKLSLYLNFDKEQLVFMIKVFFEVGFVKIDKGLLTGTPQNKHVDLEQTEVYQKRLSQIEVEEKLIRLNTNDLLNWLNKLIED
ncbi:single-stranded-DNA-specific exonuclease RecJ [Ligilactobacillus cholophilus]|uniref:single-stranded-DNA-specific exonuclease RecJ n=1 Tax=Ligilactobacillus cholophilus TaxID=3050131 RepID=UPI0025B1BE9C|nr:single-stranded-DNA-specific exonuclease RecJ [Ligilactobacillus cholophilus]